MEDLRITLESTELKAADKSSWFPKTPYPNEMLHAHSRHIQPASESAPMWLHMQVSKEESDVAVFELRVADVMETMGTPNGTRYRISWHPSWVSEQTLLRLAKEKLP